MDSVFPEHNHKQILKNKRQGSQVKITCTLCFDKHMQETSPSPQNSNKYEISVITEKNHHGENLFRFKFLTSKKAS